MPSFCATVYKAVAAAIIREIVTARRYCMEIVYNGFSPHRMKDIKITGEMIIYIPT